MANRPTESLFGVPTWLSWHHMQTLDLGRDDLKQKKRDTLHTTKTMVSLLSSSIVSRKFFYGFLYRTQLVSYCLRSSLYCWAFVMLLRVSVTRLSKWRPINVGLHARKRCQPRQYDCHVFVLLSEHDVTYVNSFKKLGAKFKKQSQDKTSTFTETIAKTIVYPLYHSFEFAVLFYCFKVGFHCSLLCDATLCLV